MLEQLIGGLVWLAANGLYIDLRRKGRSGIPRILFFWMGMPATWIWLLVVPEGSQAKPLPPPDDAEAILEAIRRDRALRGESGEPPEDRRLPDGE